MIDLGRLLDTIGIRVEKTGGGRLWARCPFPDHDDHDPSWFIWDLPGDEKHGRHHCFGCHEGGRVLDLIVKTVPGVDSKPAARRWLADGGIEYPLLAIELDDPTPYVSPKKTAEASLPANVQFGVPFSDWPTLAQRYLVSRGYSAETVGRWGLGFARTGPVSGRIIIPVRDSNGRLSTWQARSYVGDELRYLTPKRGEVGVLFGSELWPPPSSRDLLAVVEGPFDAIAVDDATRVPVGALLGSAPLPRHLAAIATFSRVIVATDNDKAGNLAADAIAGASRWVTVRRRAPPPGLDPAAISPEERRRLVTWDP